MAKRLVYPVCIVFVISVFLSVGMVPPAVAAELSTSNSTSPDSNPDVKETASPKDSSPGSRWDWSLQIQYGRELGDYRYNELSIAPRCTRRLLRVEKGGPLAGQLQFVFEPSVQVLEDDSVTAEIRLMPLLRYEFGLDKTLVPFAEAGVGILWSHCRSRRLHTEFNFSDQVRAGLDYHLSDNASLRLEYFFEHASNAGLARRNPGMEIHGPRFGCVLHF